MKAIKFCGGTLRVTSLGLVAGLALLPAVGCSESAPTDEATAEDSAAQDAASAEPGTLEFRANGEDFVRQGFVSKDGWQMNFDNLYVTLSDLKAYQVDGTFDPDAGNEIAAEETVEVSEVITVDLAEGDDQAEPVLIESVAAPAGQYNALAWKMVPATSGPADGSTLLLVGTAAQDGETIPFTIQLDPEYTYTCGEFVGDSRKGILDPGEQADVEATFHFDHVFGDGDAPADDPINTGALGFGPLAALASDGALTTDMAELEQTLSPQDYSTLEDTLEGIGHVGEGHCSEASASPASGQES